jgi:hypothetical protein
MLLGDTHGSGFWVQRMIKIAVERDVELILQLGDFGLWPGSGGLTFRNTVNDALEEAGLEMWVTGGNHDDYDQVDRAYHPDFGLGPLDPWRMESHIVWLPRGYRFVLDGTRFLSLGGAYSIDKQWRTPHKSWWVQEQITEDDVARCMDVDDRKVDVMLTHDIPRQAKPGWNRKDIFECWPNQEKIQTVVEACRPKWLFHGHLHYRYMDLMQILGGHTVRVEGLDCDGSERDAAYVIRDTSEFHSITADLEKTRSYLETLYPRTHPARGFDSYREAPPVVWP